MVQVQAQSACVITKTIQQVILEKFVIKPTLGASNLVECIETAQVVAHEVTHAILPAKTGHGPRFARIIKNYLGAEGMPTATVAGPRFTLLIKDFIEELGYLPHSKMIENKEGKGSTTVAVRCTGAETCPGASDKSLCPRLGTYCKSINRSVQKSW